MRRLLSINTPAGSTIEYYPKPPAYSTTCQLLTPAELGEKFGFTYDESMYARDAAIATTVEQLQINEGPLHKMTDIDKGLAWWLANPFEYLCLADVDERIGVSTFAKQDIPVDTVLGIYAGVIADPSHIAPEDQGYLLTLGRSPLHIAAGARGGMGRFLAHLYQDCDRDMQQAQARLEQPEFLARQFNMSEQQIRHLLKTKQITPSVIHDICAEGARLERQANPEFDDFTFATEQVKRSIAVANVTQLQIRYKGTPITVLISSLPIKKHQIVGMNYTSDYWNTKGYQPELVSPYGMVTPRTLYKRTGAVSLFLPDPTKKSKFLNIENKRAAFYNDITQGHPIYLEPFDCFISLYALRDALVAANAAPECYARLPFLNAFAQMLQRRINSLIDDDIALYWQDPITDEKTLESQTPPNPNAFTVAVVCRAKDTQSYTSLLNLFSPIRDRVRGFKETREIVIEGVNDGTLKWRP